MKCDNCSNATICKYVEEMKDTESKVKAISFSYPSPVRVEVVCSKFQPKHQPSFGFGGSAFTSTMR